MPRSSAPSANLGMIKTPKGVSQNEFIPIRTEVSPRGIRSGSARIRVDLAGRRARRRRDWFHQLGEHDRFSHYGFGRQNLQQHRPRQLTLRRRFASPFAQFAVKAFMQLLLTNPVLSRRGFRLFQGIFRCHFASFHVGLASSMRHTGLFGANCPSDFTNAGASPGRIHTCSSGGFFPSNDASTPVTPPRSIFNR